MSFLGTGWKDSETLKEGEIDVDNASEGRFPEKAGLKLPYKG